MSSSVVSTVSYRYHRIIHQLNIDFYELDNDTTHGLYVGSYGRGTAIDTSDIDMLFILPYAVYQQFDSYNSNGQSALLQAVRNSLQKTYSTSYVRGDGQVIVISFTDDITFEIVPCFLNTDGSYTYPDSNDGGRWRVTNPKPEINAINVLNNSTNNNLKRLCRMARAWKEKHSIPMGGLLIDTLAYSFLKDWEYKEKSFAYYDWMTRDFFKFLSEINDDQLYWKAVGSGQYIWRKGPFAKRALTAYRAAIEAIDYEGKDMEYSANQKWREIYGTKFCG